MAQDGSIFKLYYSTTLLAATDNATIAAHGFTEATDVSSVQSPATRSQSDYNARSGVVTTTGPAKYSKSFEMLLDNSNAFYAAIKAAFDANTAIALADVDGAIATTGTKGDAGNFLVTDFEPNEPDSGPATVSVSVAKTSFFTSDYTAP
ncbi:MAG: hypothetical protein AAGC72_01125 [Planctomycetota bacterium]